MVSSQQTRTSRRPSHEPTSSRCEHHNVAAVAAINEASKQQFAMLSYSCSLLINIACVILQTCRYHTFLLALAPFTKYA
jgi:hypothetical protein